MATSDTVTAALRGAYRKKRNADKWYYNKDRTDKPTTSYAENRQAYDERIRHLKKKNPREFAGIQERNTDAYLRVLNAIDFDRDAYAQDPISKAAFDDLQYDVSVPFGFQDEDGSAYTLPGSALGATVTAEGIPTRGQVAISSGATLPEMQKNRLGLTGLLRHEGQHRVSPNADHSEIYALDRMYQMKEKGTDRGLRNPEYQHDTDGMDMLTLMLDAKRKVKNDRGFGDSEVAPEGLDEYAKWDEVAKLPAKEKLKALQSVDEYNLSGMGMTRDLPDKGWLDESINSVKEMVGMGKKKKKNGR